MTITALKVVPRAPRVEDFPEIFNKVAGDMSLKDACATLNIHYPTVQSRLSSDPVLANDYLLARAYRGDAMAENVIEIADSVKLGTMDHKRAKVAMEGYQWAAAQLNPKGWGQATIKTEVTGKDGKDLNMGSQVVVFMLPDNGRV